MTGTRQGQASDTRTPNPATDPLGLSHLYVNTTTHVSRVLQNNQLDTGGRNLTLPWPTAGIQDKGMGAHQP